MGWLAKQRYLGLIALIVAAIAASMAYSGVFYQTGHQWYAGCWNRFQAASRQHASQPRASTSAEAVIWSKCELVAAAAAFRDGFVFVGAPEEHENENQQELRKACPSHWTDVPVYGWYIAVLDIIESRDSLTFADHFYPASATVERVLKQRWPDCDHVRAKQGYPRVVLDHGQWIWESPCNHCKENGVAIYLTYGYQGFPPADE